MIQNVCFFFFLENWIRAQFQPSHPSRICFFNQDQQCRSLSDFWFWRRIRSVKGHAGSQRADVSALTAPCAGAVDQALVPGGDQGLNCKSEGDVHQLPPTSRGRDSAESLIMFSLRATRGEQ